MKYRLKVGISVFFLTFTCLMMGQEFNFDEGKVTIGGYGELHYNYEKEEAKESKNILDFHRFVIFVGYNFNEKWSLLAEIELEHNVVNDDRGDLQLEQAYLDYRHDDYLGFRAGVLLVAAGLINENHEPTLFFGVERPEYHSRIIPTTWFGNGAGVYGNIENFEYRAVVMEGLDADGFSLASGIRGGRQKGFKSNAKNLLYNARVDYVGIHGVKLGASYIYNNAMGDSMNIPLTLTEFHAQYQANNIYAVFEIGNINYEGGEVKRSFGYYFDLGYNLASFLDWRTEVIPFFRYSETNTAASTLSGGDSEKEAYYTQWMTGISVKPISNIVLKFDYGEKTVKLDDTNTKLFNLGIGYRF